MIVMWFSLSRLAANINDDTYIICASIVLIVTLHNPVLLKTTILFNKVTNIHEEMNNALWKKILHTTGQEYFDCEADHLQT